MVAVNLPTPRLVRGGRAKDAEKVQPFPKNSQLPVISPSTSLSFMTLRAVSKPRTLRLTLSSASAASRWDALIWSSDTPWRSGYCSQFVHLRHSCASMGCRATFCCAAVSDAMKASAASLMGLVDTSLQREEPGDNLPVYGNATERLC